jgi:hypothetical protein
MLSKSRRYTFESMHLLMIDESIPQTTHVSSNVAGLTWVLMRSLGVTSYM